MITGPFYTIISSNTYSCKAALMIIDQMTYSRDRPGLYSFEIFQDDASWIWFNRK